MQSKTCRSRVRQYCSISLALTIVGGTASTALAAGPRILYGVVRDFPESHVDFGMPFMPSTPVAGNVELSLDAVGDPIYTGVGSVISSDWMTHDNHPLAPNMFWDLPQAVRLNSDPVVSNNATIDSYDPSGPYDPNNTGSNPVILTNVSMPPIPPMPTLGASVGDVIFDGNSAAIVNTSFLCDDFRIRNSYEVTISGDVTIGVTGTFEMFNYAKLILAPGANLTLYIAGAVEMNEHSQLNADAGDFSQLEIYYTGSSDITIRNNTQVYGTINAPFAKVRMRNTGDFHGRLYADSLELSQFAGFHVAGLFPPNCHLVADSEGAWGTTHTGNVTSPQSFRQWFKSVPGVNVDAAYGIKMVEDGTGAIAFSTPDFTPIDGKLFGNESQSNNRNFTYEIAAEFTHHECTNTFFEFTGDGEVWVFIDNQLVIDLNGPQKGGTQYIDIDRLLLTDGREYELRFFYAQRSNESAQFEVRTNLDLRVDPASLVTMAIYD